MTLTWDLSRHRRQGFEKGLCDVYMKEGEVAPKSQNFPQNADIPQPEA